MARLKGFDYKKAEADLDGVGAYYPDEIHSYHSEKAVRSYMKEHGLNPDKYYKTDGKCSPSGSKESDNGGCYLTTACVAARGLPDTCTELQTLRAFRDGVLARQPGGQQERRRIDCIRRIRFDWGKVSAAWLTDRLMR